MLPYLGKTDIYLLDQVMKHRIQPNMKILDAGCGNGRNSELFIRSDYTIFGIDQNEEAISALHQSLSNWNPTYPTSRFSVGDLNKIPFPNQYFDFIICSAVLHFCTSRTHFIELFEELVRVLAPSGILWFRMTAKHTIEDQATHLKDDIFLLPDGTTRYLLDKKVLEQLLEKHQLSYLDPFKTVNVSDVRTMATVVLQQY